MSECLTCYQEKEDLIKGICSQCSDILEFGYPSFEGYPFDRFLEMQRGKTI